MTLLVHDQMADSRPLVHSKEFEKFDKIFGPFHTNEEFDKFKLNAFGTTEISTGKWSPDPPKSHLERIMDSIENTDTRIRELLKSRDIYKFYLKHREELMKTYYGRKVYVTLTEIVKLKDGETPGERGYDPSLGYVMTVGHELPSWWGNDEPDLKPNMDF